MRTPTHTYNSGIPKAPKILKPSAIGRRVEPATLLNLQLAIYFLGTTFGAHVTCYESYSTGASEHTSIFLSVLFLFLFCLFFFFFGFWGLRVCGCGCVCFCACECECICCSFHLNYPVADLLVTTWRCTILKHFVYHTVRSTIEYSLRVLFECSTILS